MTTLLADLRHALRTLRRSPGYTAVAVLTLALGIGANTVAFSLVNAVLLRPPGGVAAPGRLVGLYTSDYSGPAYGTSSYPDVREFSRRREVFAGVTAYAPRPVAVGDEAAPERIVSEVVSGSYFAVLGVQPALGRALGEADARERAGVVVISDALWRRRFAADSSVIGRTLVVNGRRATIAGVAPAGFVGMTRGVRVDAWIPIEASAQFGVGGTDYEERGTRSFLTLARLSPGTSAEEARAHMRVLAENLRAAYSDSWTDVRGDGRRISVLSERRARVPGGAQGAVVGVVALIGVTVGLVLLICCANVAGLALARASRRAREHAVRLALGASRGRLVVHLLAESLMLAALGGAAALLATVWLSGFVNTAPLPVDVPIHLDVSPDVRVLGFSALATLLTASLFGLAPALRASRTDLTAVLKAERTVLTIGRRRLPLQSVLVVVQMATSVLLLAAALLFVRALQGAAAVDPGFRSAGVLLATAGPRVSREGESSAAAGLTIRERVLALPGVRAVSWATVAPLGFEVSRRGVQPEDYTPAPGEDMEVAFNVVGPTYFATLALPLLAGRDFALADRAGAGRVVVVNEAFARRYWPGQDALGKSIGTGGRDGQPLRVVGVARTTKYQSLAEEPRPYVYFSALQEDGWGVILHVRADAAPRALLGAVRAAVEGAQPGWTVASARTLDEQVAASLLPQRIAGTVLGLFGVVALLLAAVGLYGVIAYAVATRTREIGVRVALGATGTDVLRMVLRQTGTLVGIGLLVGLPLAWGAARLLRAMLLGTGGPADPLPFMGAAALLGAVALLASVVPARRAMRIDPARALHAD